MIYFLQILKRKFMWLTEVILLRCCVKVDVAISVLDPTIINYHVNKLSTYRI